MSNLICSRCGYSIEEGVYCFCPNCGAKIEGTTSGLSDDAVIPDVLGNFEMPSSNVQVDQVKSWLRIVSKILGILVLVAGVIGIFFISALSFTATLNRSYIYSILPGAGMIIPCVMDFVLGIGGIVCAKAYMYYNPHNRRRTSIALNIVSTAISGFSLFYACIMFAVIKACIH